MTPEEIGEWLFKHHQHAVMDIDEKTEFHGVVYTEKDVLDLLTLLGYTPNWDWYKGGPLDPDYKAPES